MPTGCAFCAHVLAAPPADAAVVFPDRFPLTDGHVLVVPRRHVERVEDLQADEWRALFDRVGRAARDASAMPDVTGVNIGVNSGRSAGQTVPHAHVHVIPRRDGDVDDPRGGVRWVVPRRAAYWEAT